MKCRQRGCAQENKKREGERISIAISTDYIFLVDGMMAIVMSNEFHSEAHWEPTIGAQCAHTIKYVISQIDPCIKITFYIPL